MPRSFSLASSALVMLFERSRQARTDDLRFTTHEATVFLNRVMESDLSLEDTATLEARTERWVVGLQMAALSLQSQADAAGFRGILELHDWEDV